MKNVRDILREKGKEVSKVTPQTTVFDALKLMAENNIGSVLVLDADHLVGIFSERDYARKVILKGKASKDTPVKEIMSSEVVYARLNQPIEECMALMTHKRVRHLPVFEDDQLVGVISIGDVVKATISEQDHLIHQLEDYIVGRR